MIERDGPGIQEDDLDVEDDEQHRGEVVLHGEPDSGRLASGLNAALVGLELGPVPPPRARERPRDQRENGEDRGQYSERDDRHVVAHRFITALPCSSWLTAGRELICTSCISFRL